MRTDKVECVAQGLNKQTRNIVRQLNIKSDLQLVQKVNYFKVN